ncbi:MAG TPA: hypothetical protein PKH77_08640 [Anaerolineae bacterium]|nr:hypothetical protein [Anaerolineae bacterium]
MMRRAVLLACFVLLLAASATLAGVGPEIRRLSAARYGQHSAAYGGERRKAGWRGLRELGRSQFGNECVVLPPEIPMMPETRLLSVIGSGYGLSFLARGPIYEEAMRHPDLEIFGGR